MKEKKAENNISNQYESLQLHHRTELMIDIPGNCYRKSQTSRQYTQLLLAWVLNGQVSYPGYCLHFTLLKRLSKYEM